MTERDTYVMSLLTVGMPAKIIQLDKIVKNLNTVGWTEDQQFSYIQSTLTHEVFEIIHNLSDLLAFLKRRIPKIEDGHNSGVDTINIVGAEVSALYTRMSTLELALVNTYNSAGVRYSKMKKYPEAEDYLRGAILAREMRSRDIVFNLEDIRDSYEAVVNAMTKNLDKILNPRNVSRSDMY